MKDLDTHLDAKLLCGRRVSCGAANRQSRCLGGAAMARQRKQRYSHMTSRKAAALVTELMALVAVHW